MKTGMQYTTHTVIGKPKRLGLPRGNSGMALFLAISLLALFSVLGASYMRFMSLELDDSDMRIRDMRIRNYATAGINSAAGHIQSAFLAGGQPPPSYVFTYAVYGEAQEKTSNPLHPLATYTAQARVSVEVLDNQEWNSRVTEKVPWPGEGRAFCITSIAELQRAVPGGIITLADHAVEAVMIAHETQCRFLTWHSVNAKAALDKQK